VYITQPSVLEIDMDEAEAVKQITPEIEQTAALKAKDRARAARWDLDIAVFLFGVLAIIIILLFQGIGVEIVAPIAVFGLAMVWFVGWRRGRQLYQRFYQEELSHLQHEVSTGVRQAIEETLEEMVQRALRDRRQ